MNIQIVKGLILATFCTVFLVACNEVSSDSVVTQESSPSKDSASEKEDTKIQLSEENSNSISSSTATKFDENYDYIEASGVANYIPSGVEFETKSINLKGNEFPEVVGIYNRQDEGLSIGNILILEYNPSLEKWGIVYQEEYFTVDVHLAGILNLNSGTENSQKLLALGLHYDGSGLYTEVDLIGYNGFEIENMYKLMSEYAPSGAITVDETKKSVKFSGTQQSEYFVWNEEINNFTSVIEKEKTDYSNSKYHITYSIEGGEIYTNFNSIENDPSTYLHVKNGDIITVSSENVSTEEANVDVLIDSTFFSFEETNTYSVNNLSTGTQGYIAIGLKEINFIIE